MCDQWYIDDGQAFIQPDKVDGWLRTLDTGLKAFGATHGTKLQGDVKSSCRLLCPPADVGLRDGWVTDYMTSACNVLDTTDPTIA